MYYFFDQPISSAEFKLTATENNESGKFVFISEMLTHGGFVLIVQAFHYLTPVIK